MEAMGLLGFVFGTSSMTFGIFGFIAFNKINQLEKKLKETGILDQEYKSE